MSGHTAMRDHTVKWAISRGGIVAEFVCHAEADAWCRMGCQDGCDEWSRDHDEIEDHKLVPGDCTAVEWVTEATTPADCYDGSPVSIHDGPVELEWVGGGYYWRYAEVVVMSDDYRPEWWPPRVGDVLERSDDGYVFEVGCLSQILDHKVRGGGTYTLHRRDGEWVHLPWREYADPEFVPGMIVAPEDEKDPKRWCYWPTGDLDTEPFVRLTTTGGLYWSWRGGLPDRLRVICTPAEVAS